jgi:hypothetical protein
MSTPISIRICAWISVPDNDVNNMPRQANVNKDALHDLALTCMLYAHLTQPLQTSYHTP